MSQLFEDTDVNTVIYSIAKTDKAIGLRFFPHLKPLLENLSCGVSTEACQERSSSNAPGKLSEKTATSNYAHSR